MNVLVLGAYGLIGSDIVRSLSEAGHAVTGLGRQSAYARSFTPGIRWLTADMAELTTGSAWRPLLTGIDAVVNAAGALQSGLRDDLAKVQRDSIVALIAECEAQGITRYIQISAPGAAADAKTEFLRTKGEADDALRRSALDWVILRPGLVIAPTAHGGTSVVRALAAFPVVQPLLLPDARVHTIDIEDVSAAVVRALTDASLGRRTFDLGEPEPLSLAETVSTFRAWLGFNPAKATLSVPAFLGTAISRLADLAGHFGWRAPLRSTSLDVLSEGIVIDPEPWQTATGQSIKPLAQTLARIPATRQERSFARLELIFPVLVVAFAAFWIASGVIGLVRMDAAAQTVSAAVGEGMARMAVVAGSLLDIAIGAAMLFRRTFRSACLAAALTALAYLVLGSLLTPHLWSDPLGHLLKIVPVIGLALALASYAEER